MNRPLEALRAIWRARVQQETERLYMMRIRFVTKTELEVLMSRQQLLDISAILAVVGKGYMPSKIDQARAAELEKAIAAGVGR